MRHSEFDAATSGYVLTVSRQSFTVPSSARILLWRKRQSVRCKCNDAHIQPFPAGVPTDTQRSPLLIDPPDSFSRAN